MKRKMVVVLLVLGLVGLSGSPGAAQVLGYNMDRSGKGFAEKPASGVSAAVVAADALIARPVGLALTAAGTVTFLITLPMSIPSGSVGIAAHGLIVKPGGYTFVRPLGRDDTRFEERSLFGE
ncbi:MAG TPA: hypothetical protein VIN67_03270 [Desulfobaccales bacterium]